jgi:hypothetical protein
MSASSEALTMNLRCTLTSAIVGTVLALGLAALPSESSPAAYNQTTEVQSVLGRITSVQGNTFTLAPTKQKKSVKGSQAPKNANVLTLTVDQDTDVQGKIAVGADANVTYRQEDGNNVAVSVRIVQQPS